MNKYLFVLVVSILLAGFLFQFSPGAQALQLLDIEKEIETRESKEFRFEEYSQNKKLAADTSIPFSLDCLSPPFYSTIDSISSSGHSLLISSHKLFIHSPPASL